MKKDDRVYCLHIRDAIRKIEDYISHGKEGFFNDPKTQDAVVRNLEIIGEATKNVSMKIKEAYSEIPWKQIAGMRDKMIHEYFGVDLKIVWEAVEQNIPKLAETIEAILTETK